MQILFAHHNHNIGWWKNARSMSYMRISTKICHWSGPKNDKIASSERKLFLTYACEIWFFSFFRDIDNKKRILNFGNRPPQLPFFASFETSKCKFEITFFDVSKVSDEHGESQIYCRRPKILLHFLNTSYPSNFWVATAWAWNFEKSIFAVLFGRNPRTLLRFVFNFTPIRRWIPTAV